MLLPPLLYYCILTLSGKYNERRTPPELRFQLFYHNWLNRRDSGILLLFGQEKYMQPN